MNEDGAENRQDRRTRQESGASLKPCLVPEHALILLNRLQEDLA
jgi:hypothetical protein